MTSRSFPFDFAIIQSCHALLSDKREWEELNLNKTEMISEIKNSSLA